MSRTTLKSRPEPAEFAAHFYLLGIVDFEDCLSLQRRLAYDALSRADGRIAVLICEHPPLVTIGRGGSRAHVRLTGEQLDRRQIAVRYVGRGGGAVLHEPGQLAIYPIVPLAWHGWSIGEYLRRFQAALLGVLGELKLRPQPVPASYALAGRAGVLAAVGISVRNRVTGQGAYLNVNPDMRDQGRVGVLPGRSMSSVLSERPLPVKMTAVRAAVVAHLATQLGCQRHHLHTGHPLLAELSPSEPRDYAA